MSPDFILLFPRNNQDNCDHDSDRGDSSVTYCNLWVVIKIIYIEFELTLKEFFLAGTDHGNVLNIL